MSDSAIQQYLLLAKSAKGKGCTALIEQALNASGVYVFGELLDMPNVQALEANEHKPYLDLLKIFAYETYPVYKRNAATLPPLSPQMLTKLRQLTIVSLSAEHKVIPYATLLQQLDIANLRELEDLIIECIYQELIKGKLDQKTKQLEVDFAIGRDIPREKIDHMMNVLSNWVQRSELMLKSIMESVDYAKNVHEVNRKERAEFEQKLDTVKSTIKASAEADIYHVAGHEYESQEYLGEQTRKRNVAHNNAGDINRANKMKGKEFNRRT